MVTKHVMSTGYYVNKLRFYAAPDRADEDIHYNKN